MKIQHDRAFLITAKSIQKALETSPQPLFIAAEDIASDLTLPPNPDLGDFAFGCFKLAKELKQNPAALAKALEGQILADKNLSEHFLSVGAVGPYLNLRLKGSVIWESFGNSALTGELFNSPVLLEQPKTMIEFSQPNTHKELHVGHMRNACLGDALIRIKRFAGIEVVSSTFPGDVGAHVAKCLWYLKYHNQEAVPVTHQGEWLGQLYSKAHLKLEAEKGSSLEEPNRQQLTFILKQLENKQGEFYDLWQETRQWSIDLMERIYNWLDIKFDVWYWESEVDEPSRQYVTQLLDQGKLVRSQGAVGMDLSEEKLGFCLLLKSDGTGLYATKDLELARRKFLDYKIERSVYVVDLRQALHFSQVFKTLEKLGFEQAKNCYHLQYNFVELPDGAMSSRKGNIIPITDLVVKMEAMIKDKYLSRYQGEWSSAEVDIVAHQVALGAIKYGMLRMDTSKKIVFDMNEWLKIDGESGPFIQYSAARIKSLVKKAGETLKNSGYRNWDQLTHLAEQKLMGQLLYFKSVVKITALQEKPHLLTSYLYDLSKAFNYFYHECPIHQAESEALKSSRLDLARVTGQVLSKGLEILGIPTPDRM